MTTPCQLALCAINISEEDRKVVLRFQALPIKAVWVSRSIPVGCLLTVCCRGAQPLPLHPRGHTDTSAAVLVWHGGPREPEGAAKLGGNPPFITSSFKQTWSQKQRGHQKAPTEKPFFWRALRVMGGWKQHTSSQRSGCPVKEADVKPFGSTTWDYTTSEETSVKQDLSPDMPWRQRQQGKYTTTSPSTPFTLW